jgi:hypothetical protein
MVSYGINMCFKFYLQGSVGAFIFHGIIPFHLYSASYHDQNTNSVQNYYCYEIPYGEGQSLEIK